MPTQTTFCEVDELFRCPVVGVCLSPVEQRCLLKKLGLGPDGLSRYDMHELLVQILGGSSAAPVLRLLKTKYERRAAPLRALPEDDFVRAWLEAFAAGDCRAELWAAATRPLSDVARRTLYGRLHMAMHGLAEEQTRMRAELEAANKKLQRNEHRLVALDAERAALGAEVEKLRKLAGRLESERAAIRRAAARSVRELPQHGAGERVAEQERDNARLRDEVAAAEALLMEQENVQSELRARLAELEQRLEQAVAPRDAAAQEILTCDTAHCNEQCPSFDLCRKRVLIVGGIERMETLYRKLVEERGGVLEYHAGHMRGGARQLEKSLQRADVVLCPVNCNSHGACVLVKNLAKKYRKPVHMMPNFSLSAVAGVIGAHAANASSAA